MNRNHSHEAIILSARSIGELHRGVTAFTPDAGLLSLIAFGAQKHTAKLRISTETFLHCRLGVYSDPVKQSNKITDVEVLDSYDGIRQSLERLTVASLAGEVVLRAMGGGDENPRLFSLLLDTLTALDSANPREASRLAVQFMARFLSSEGSLPPFDSCSECGRPFRDDESAHPARSAEGLLCASCCLAVSPENQIIPSARRYIVHTLPAPLATARRVDLADAAFGALSLYLVSLTEDHIGTRIHSLSMGGL